MDLTILAVYAIFDNLLIFRTQVFRTQAIFHDFQ